MTILNTIKTVLLETKNPQNPNSPYTFLPILNTLTYALNKTDHHYFLESQRSKQITAVAQQTYQKILITRFLPALKNILETKLQSSSQNPSDLYETLKVYLMLNDLQHRDPQFLKQWFSQYSRQTLTNNLPEQQQLNQQLTIALQQNLTLSTDPTIITVARNHLNQIPLAQLSYSVLQDHHSQPIE